MRKSSIANHPLATQVTFHIANKQYATDEKTLRTLLYIDRYAKTSIAEVMERGQSAGAIRLVLDRAA